MKCAISGASPENQNSLRINVNPVNAELDQLLSDWTDATGNLQWGVQRAFYAVFEAVRDQDTKLVYGADYLKGFPCLVNSVGTMLSTGGGHGVPSSNYGTVVMLFDRINRILRDQEVNVEHGLVSPLAADVFIQHFAPLKDIPVVPSHTDTSETVNPWISTEETSDVVIEQALNEMFLTPAPVEPDWIASNVTSSQETAQDTANVRARNQ